MKTINLKQITLALVLVIFIGIQTSNAQSIDRVNRVEYQNSDSEFEDLNSISLKKPRVIKRKTSTKTKKKKIYADSDISIEDLQKISQLRFRKKTKRQEKCLKESEVKCDSLDEKSKLLPHKKSKN